MTHLFSNIVLILTFLLVALPQAFAQPVDDDYWVTLSHNHPSYIDGKKNTGRLFTHEGKQYIGAQVRFRNLSTNKIDFYLLVIPEADCRAGFGKMRFLHPTGEKAFENTWMLNGGTLAAGVADVMCFVMQQDRKPASTPKQPSNTNPLEVS